MKSASCEILRQTLPNHLDIKMHNAEGGIVRSLAMNFFFPAAGTFRLLQRRGYCTITQPPSAAAAKIPAMGRTQGLQSLAAPARAGGPLTPGGRWGRHRSKGENDPEWMIFAAMPAAHWPSCFAISGYGRVPIS
jgi:hypothetical protein